MKVKNILKVAGITAAKIVDNAVAAGVVTNVIEDTVENPKGKFDWLKFIRVLVCSTTPIVILIGESQGWWTIEQAEQAIEAAKDIKLK